MADSLAMGLANAMGAGLASMDVGNVSSASRLLASGVMCLLITH